MHISWARLASFCHLGFISDPLIVSKFHNETHDSEGQENKIYTIINTFIFPPKQLSRYSVSFAGTLLLHLRVLRKFLEAQRDRSSLLLFHKIHCGAVSIEKDKNLTTAHSLKLPGHHTVPNIVDTRRTVMTWRAFPQWNRLSLSVVNSQTIEELRRSLFSQKQS